MTVVDGGITKPKGFFAGAIWCGLKKKSADLCLIYSQVPAAAAGVFTSNKVQAAPVLVSKNNLKGGRAQAIIANSGNANCLTGKAGLVDAEKMASAAAKALGIDKKTVLTASTGVIGRRLAVAKITSAIDRLVSSLSSAGSMDAAKSMMTTDTVPKEIAVSVKIDNSVVSIGAIAKGAGMISPNMATMLCFITTDAAITAPALKRALKESVDASFNRITVDGDMSTNDSVLILANGLAGNKVIAPSGKSYDIFKKALTRVCYDMAEKIVRDGEGATKFVKIIVKGARNFDEAKKAAYAIATSPLVKTALYGNDPNWGRIAAAAGRSGAEFNQSNLDIYLGKVKVLSGGAPLKVNPKLLRKIFEKKDIEIQAALNNGKSSAEILTSDLSKEYVAINAHYTT